MTPKEEPIRHQSDPTPLTTAALNREVSSLRAILETRFDGIDTLIHLIQANISSRKADIDTAVEHLKKLHEEKFHSIEIQFAERDTRTEQTSRDSKVAVDAALQAAKEAVGEQNKSSALAIAKSEAGTTKQIDQIGVLINSTNNAVNDKVDDLKARLASMSGKSEGISYSGSVLLGIVTLVSALIAIGSVVYKSRETTAPVPQVIYLPTPAPAVIPSKSGTQ